MEKINKKEVEIHQFIYLCAYLALLCQFFIARMSTYSNFNFINNIAKVIDIFALICILIKLSIDKHTLKSIIKMIILGAIFFASLRNSGLKHLFYIILLVIGAKGVDIKEVLMKDIKIRLFLIIFIVISSLIGVIDNYETIRYSNENITRYALGFTHSNGLGQAILSYIAIRYYIKGSFNKISNIIVALISLILIDFITDSRTSVICIFILFIIQVLESTIKIHERAFIKRLIANLSILMVPILTIFSIIVTINFSVDNSIIYTVDKLMSHRFMQAYNIINIYGFSLIGQKIQFISSRQAQILGMKSMILDNAYLQLAVSMGVIILIIICILFISLSIDAIKKNDYKLLILIVIYALLGLSETGFNYVFFNFTLLFFSNIIYKSDRRKRLRVRYRKL